MGCDVHMFAEVRNRKTGKWEYQKKKFPYEYYDPEKTNFIDDDGYEWNPEFTDEPFEGSSYDTFAILANVRNGRGFAGIKTGEGFTPMSMPKGVPEDASPEYLKNVDDWYGDGHSHSFFTVAELKAYDWNQTTAKRGIVSVEEYKRIEGKGQPSGWSAGISGPNIFICYSPADKKLLLKGNPSIEVAYTHVEHTWEISYAETASYFLQTVLPRLEALGDPEDVRIVFFFDN